MKKPPSRLATGEDEDGGGCGQKFEKVEGSDMKGMVLRSSKLIVVQDLMAPTTSSRGHHEEMRIVHDGMQIRLHRLYMRDDERLEENSTRYSRQ